jgi:hypothetical protein
MLSPGSALRVAATHETSSIGCEKSSLGSAAGRSRIRSPTEGRSESTRMERRGASPQGFRPSGRATTARRSALETAVVARKLSTPRDGLTEVSAQLLGRLAYEAADCDALSARSSMRPEELTYAARVARRGGRPRTGQDTRSDQGHAPYRKSLVPHDNTPLRWCSIKPAPAAERRRSGGACAGSGGRCRARFASRRNPRWTALRRDPDPGGRYQRLCHQKSMSRNPSRARNSSSPPRPKTRSLAQPGRRQSSPRPP